MSGTTWKHITFGVPFPFKNAVRAGTDLDGSAIYVGRCFHEGQILPAKVIGDKLIAYVSLDGEEFAKDSFDVLIQGDYVWEYAADGVVPEGAVQIGQSEGGEVLFIARCLHEGTQTPGKLQPTTGVLYIPFNGEEVAQSEYEVLVVK